MSLAPAAKRDREVPVIQPLQTLLVEFKPLDGTPKFPLEVIPDTGANVTAIPATAALGIVLHDSKIVLRAANGIPLRVVGAFHARISLQQNSTDEIVYVVRGLSRPLLSRTTMKELGLIHPDFPYQDLAQAHALQSFHAKPTTSDFESQKHVQVPSPPPKQDPIVTDHGPTFDRLFNEYADLFDGRCIQMKSADYSIEVEKDVKPVSY